MKARNFVLVLILVFLDFISKFLVVKFNIHFGIINYVQNTGVAFGLFNGFNWVFILIDLVFIFILVYLLFFKNGFFEFRIGLGLILAGAIGNLIDRVVYGFVIDFIDLKYWYVFNLADVFIVIGVCLILIKMLRKKE